MRYVIGRITVRPGKREEFLARAESYVAASRADIGCLYFDVTPRPDDPNGIVMIEHWADLETHLAHQARDYALAFRPVAGSYFLHAEFEEMTVPGVEKLVFDFEP